MSGEMYDCWIEDHCFERVRKQLENGNIITLSSADYIGGCKTIVTFKATVYWDFSCELRRFKLDNYERRLLIKNMGPNAVTKGTLEYDGIFYICTDFLKEDSSKELGITPSFVIQAKELRTQ